MRGFQLTVLRGTGVLLLVLAATVVVSCTSATEEPGAVTEATEESSPSPSPTPGISENDVSDIEDVVRDYRTAADTFDYGIRKRSSTGDLNALNGWFERVAIPEYAITPSRTEIKKLEVNEVDSVTAEVTINATSTPMGEAPEPEKIRGTYTVVRTQRGWLIENFQSRAGDDSDTIFAGSEGGSEISGAGIKIEGVSLDSETGHIFMEIENHTDASLGADFEGFLVDDRGAQYTGSTWDITVHPGAKLLMMYQFEWTKMPKIDSKRIRLIFSLINQSSYDSIDFDIPIRLR